MLSLALDTELPPVAQEHLESALECTHFLLNIINTLLDFSKLEAKHVQLTPLHFPFRSSIGKIVSIGSLAEKGVMCACVPCCVHFVVRARTPSACALRVLCARHAGIVGARICACACMRECLDVLMWMLKSQGMHRGRTCLCARMFACVCVHACARVRGA